jgi:uncharacterized protein (TIGR00369 family)
MKFKFPQDSQIVMTQLMLPSHSNFSGKIHGGYILSLMDQIAFACASKHSGHYCVTASVHKVDFLHPVEVGDLLTLKATINFTGKTSMVVGLRVESENIKTGEIRHCNSSYFTMVAKDDKGNNVVIPGLIIRSNDEIRRFVRSIQYKEHTKKEQEGFAASDFHPEDYLKSLESQNVKIG